MSEDVGPLARRGVLWGADSLANESEARQSYPGPQEARRSESEFLRAVVDFTPDLIQVKDAAGRLVFANKACLAMIGRGVEDVLGRPVGAWHGQPDESGPIEANDRRVLDSGDTLLTEELFTDPQGRRRVFLSTKAALRGDDGTITGLIGISTDITQRKQSEQAHRRSETRFRAAVDAMDGVLWTADATGARTGDETGWTRLTGQDGAEAAELGWTHVVHPEDVPATLAGWRAAVAAGEPYQFEHRVRRRDGRWRLCTVRAVPVADQYGQIVEWVGVHTDVTEERENQTRLADTLQQLSLALDIGEIGVWSYTPEGLTLDCDDRMRGLFGVAPDEPLDTARMKALVFEEDLPRLSAQIGQATREGVGAVFESEFRIRRSDTGEVRWITARGQQVAQPQAAEVRFIGTCRDVTSRREREEQVRGLLRELSHRTKNILAVIQAVARQTVMNSRDIADFRPRFEARLQAMSRSLDLLVEHHWHGATLHEVVRAQLGDEIGHVSLDGPVLYLKPDAAQNLGLAMHELTTNAVNYGSLSTQEGRVEVTWRIEDGHFHLSWREVDGPPVTPPVTKGFGQTLMQRLALGGESELRFEPDGVVWEMTAPIGHVLGKDNEG